MKQVIVFYYSEPGAAKIRSRELAAKKPTNVRTFDVAVWDGSDASCDEIVIMPDVPDWQIARIKRAYPGVLPEGETETDTGIRTGVVEKPLTAEHRGGGKWYVMRGDEEISGPHARVEANKIVTESRTEVAA